jgi:hypothetical protein
MYLEILYGKRSLSLKSLLYNCLKRNLHIVGHSYDYVCVCVVHD